MDEIFSTVDFGEINYYLSLDDVTDCALKNGDELWVTSNIHGHYLSDTKIPQVEVERIANQIAHKMNKEFNPSNPSLEGDIQGSEFDYRIGCVHRFLSPAGTSMVIRKVRKKAYLTQEYLVKSNYITQPALNVLIAATKGRANIIIIGETGSGKTELLKFLIRYIPSSDVVVTIEDSMEFNVREVAPHCSCNAFRIRENVSYRDLISMSLRLNVQRILLQEARGEEVNDLLEAMSTGHSVMTTMHAKDADTIVSRIKQMLKNSQESFDSLRKRVYSLVDIVVCVEKIETKQGIIRRVSSITEFLYDPITDEARESVIYIPYQPIKSLSDSLMHAISKHIQVGYE